MLICGSEMFKSQNKHLKFKLQTGGGAGSYRDAQWGKVDEGSYGEE